MTTHTFALPDVGEGLTEAEIVRWLVAEGQDVEVNAPVVEVETAKSIVELPSPWAGRVQRLLVPEGLTVDVGTAILAVDVTGEEDDDAPVVPTTAPAQAPTQDGARDGSPEDGPEGVQAPAPAGERPAPTGPTTWPAPAPAPAAPEASPQAGPPGASGAAAAPARSAVLVGYGTSDAGAPSRRRRSVQPAAAGAPSTGTRAATPAPSAAPGAPGASATPAAPAAPAPAGARPLASPPVRSLARDLGVDLGQVPGSGPGGVVTRGDVLAHHAPEPLPAVSEDTRESRLPVRGVRKMTAQAMVRSAFTAPHATAFITVDVSRTMKLLDRLRGDRAFQGIHVSPLLVLSKAVCLAIGRHPEINSTWDEAAQEIVVKQYVNLGIAVATPRGLLVPNIKEAQSHDLRHLAGELTSLVKTARSGRSTPTDLAGGTISITNIGVFGVDTGTPILNPGEAAILCLGAVTQRAWVHKGKVRPRWVAELSISFDHRIIDGDLGSRFLADVAGLLERPDRALLWA